MLPVLACRAAIVVKRVNSCDDTNDLAAAFFLVGRLPQVHTRYTLVCQRPITLWRGLSTLIMKSLSTIFMGETIYVA